MLDINVSFLNISSKFVQTFVLSVNKLLNACSLRDDFTGNVAKFNVYKWRHSSVIVIKLTAGTQN